MARSNYRGQTARRAPKDLGRRIKKKPCALCRDGIEWVDYKDVPLLRRFVSDRGKIRSRRVTGNCAQHQRGIAEAIKTARELVLLPYTQRTVTERPGARRSERDGSERSPGGPGHERGGRPRSGPPSGGPGSGGPGAGGPASGGSGSSAAAPSAPASSAPEPATEGVADTEAAPAPDAPAPESAAARVEGEPE